MKRFCPVNKVFPSAKKEPGTHYSEWLHVGSLHELLVLVNLTDYTGDKHTLNITFQTSPDASTPFDHTTLAQMSLATTKVEPITNFGKFVRLKALVADAGDTVTFEAFIVAKS